MRFTETAWQRLEMVALLVEPFWSAESRDTVNALKEIRLNEALFGATPVDLQRLRWDLADDDTPRPPVRDELAKWRGKRRVVDPATKRDGV